MKSCSNIRIGHANNSYYNAENDSNEECAEVRTSIVTLVAVLSADCIEEQADVVFESTPLYAAVFNWIYDDCSNCSREFCPEEDSDEEEDEEDEDDDTPVINSNGIYTVDTVVDDPITGKRKHLPFTVFGYYSEIIEKEF